MLPDVALKGLDKIKISKPDINITDGDVDDMIDNLRRQKGEWVEVDRKAAEGDRVVVDFDGRLKGEPIQGGKGSEVPITLGEGQMLPDFEKALYGVSAGEEKSFKVKFPKEYHAEDLQGKKVDFDMTVHRVEALELPPLDDSLAEAHAVLGFTTAMRCESCPIAITIIAAVTRIMPTKATVLGIRL